MAWGDWWCTAANCHGQHNWSSRIKCRSCGALAPWARPPKKVVAQREPGSQRHQPWVRAGDGGGGFAARAEQCHVVDDMETDEQPDASPKSEPAELRDRDKRRSWLRIKDLAQKLGDREMETTAASRAEQLRVVQPKPAPRNAYAQAARRAD
eukprot:11461673-Alexandrium_andersonii.AAC.1